MRPLLDQVNRAVLDNLPLAQESSPMFLTRWRRLADRLDLVEPWWAAHHDRLAAHAERAAELIGGDALLHWDIRADNVVVTADRTVLVDWGQARRGAEWTDHAALALDCSLTGSELSTSELAAVDPVLRDRDPADLLALAAAEAMSLVSRSTEPAPRGLPTLPATSARWAESLRPYLEQALDEVR